METLTNSTVENNKLIAEFLGIKPNRGGEYEMSEVLDFIDSRPYSSYYFCSEMKFHSSWDWIMRAVERAEAIGAKVTIGRMFCKIEYQNALTIDDNFNIEMVSGVKINAVNASVVKFIKWYNNARS